MNTDLILRCRCERLELTVREVSPDRACHVSCGCQGCRQAAQRMRPELLGAHGETQRFQVSPACVEITRGREHLACLQQTPRGALRWYAACCDTPIALTLRSARIPFIAFDVMNGVDTEALLRAIGPMRARVNTKTSDRERAREIRADGRALREMLRHFAPLVWRWWRRGDHRRSPFFDHETGAPAVEVHRLQDTRVAKATGCR